MPTKIYNRLWCKHCSDWKLFFKEFPNKDLKCSDCNVVHDKTLLSEIPEDKILEQRERFKEKRSYNFRRTINMISSLQYGTPGYDFSDDILESDAGLQSIEQYQKEKRDERLKEIKEDINAHKDIGRNEKCKCGSNKKYKQCCLIRIKSYN